MSRMQRNKGKDGEREAAALLAGITGLDIRRRVRQHDGDTDLEGLPGWSLEIKRYAAAPRGEIARWASARCCSTGPTVAAGEPAGHPTTTPRMRSRPIPRRGGA